MSKTGSETGNSKTPLIFALESRLLFDGDLGTEAAAAIVYRDGTEATIDAVAPENQRENLPAADADAPVELVFIDNSLEDLDTLVTAIPEGSEIYFIDSASDGFDQIAGCLMGATVLTRFILLAMAALARCCSAQPVFPAQA